MFFFSRWEFFIWYIFIGDLKNVWMLISIFGKHSQAKNFSSSNKMSKRRKTKNCWRITKAWITWIEVLLWWSTGFQWIVSFCFIFLLVKMSGTCSNRCVCVCACVSVLPSGSSKSFHFKSRKIQIIKKRIDVHNSHWKRICCPNKHTKRCGWANLKIFNKKERKKKMFRRSKMKEKKETISQQVFCLMWRLSEPCVSFLRHSIEIYLFYFSKWDWILLARYLTDRMLYINCGSFRVSHINKTPSDSTVGHTFNGTVSFDFQLFTRRIHSATSFLIEHTQKRLISNRLYSVLCTLFCVCVCCASTKPH